MAAVSKFYNRFKIYIHNTSWLMGEKIITMGVGFLVTVLVARYLGPEQYGILAYALSLTALFATAGHMGLGGLVVREIVKKPEARPETLGTSMGLKFFGFALGFILLIAYALLFEEQQGLEFWALVIVGTSLLFRPFTVIDFWFQSQVQSKYTAISNLTSLLLTAGIKVLLVVLGANLLLFAFAPLVQAVLAGIFFLAFFYAKANLPLMSWRFSLERAKELLSQGWVILLGALFATVYLKIDQVMLRWFSGAKEVGVYAVAASLSEAWYFVPTAIVASLFPRLISLRDTDPLRYRERLQQVFELLFVIALAVAIFMTFMASPLIDLFFGEKYTASAPILAIHIWAALFIFMRAAFSKWILIEDALVFSLITQGFGALANVVLNYILMPHYAGYGAAIATLLSYAMASYFSLFFYKKSRPVFWMMTKAMGAPIRYPLNYLIGKMT